MAVQNVSYNFEKQYFTWTSSKQKGGVSWIKAEVAGFTDPEKTPLNLVHIGSVAEEN